MGWLAAESGLEGTGGGGRGRDGKKGDVKGQMEWTRIEGDKEEERECKE